MEFRGRIYKMLPLTTGTRNDGTTWQRQDFVFEYFENDDARWSDKVLLYAMGDNIGRYDLHEGEEVIIGFEHKVKEYNGRFFNDLRVYKLEKVAVTQQQTQQTAPYMPGAAPYMPGAAAQMQGAAAQIQGAAPQAGKKDGLPF